MTKTKAKTELGKRLRETRERAGLTQEELARRAGCDARTIRRIELGTSPGSLRALAELEQALGIPAGQLVGTEETVNPKPQHPALALIITGQDLMNFLGAADAFKYDIDDADTPETMELVKEILGAFELAEVWSDLSPVQKYDEQVTLSRPLERLRALGWHATGVYQTYDYPLPGQEPFRAKVAFLKLWDIERRMKQLEEVLSGSGSGLNLDGFRSACATGDAQAVARAWEEIERGISAAGAPTRAAKAVSPLN